MPHQLGQSHPILPFIQRLVDSPQVVDEQSPVYHDFNVPIVQHRPALTTIIQHGNRSVATDVLYPDKRVDGVVIPRDWLIHRVVPGWSEVKHPPLLLEPHRISKEGFVVPITSLNIENHLLAPTIKDRNTPDEGLGQATEATDVAWHFRKVDSCCRVLTLQHNDSVGQT